MKLNYLYGAMAAGLFFGACSNDSINDIPESPGSDVDRTLYVKMNIRGDMGTRAAADNGTPDPGTDFSNGNGESLVNNAYFVFYDADGNPVGGVINVKLGTEITTATGGTVEKYYQSVVPVSLTKGENTPTQVVCYINPISPASLQSPLSTIETVTRTQLYTQNVENGPKYFAMSNSVYYPVNENTGYPDPNAEPSIAVPVSANQLKQSKEDADALLGSDDMVNIYVERYASKLAFKSVEAEDYVTATSQINDAEETVVTLSFVPFRWALNAGCTESYVVKSFRQEADNGSVLPANYSYSEMNKRINASSVTGTGTPVYGAELNTNDSWAWNAGTLNRSYWSCSPAYFNSEFPEVSSDVNPDDGINQHYWSYNELLENGYLQDQPGTAESTYHYFHETTVGGRALISKNPAAAVPSVIFVGNYEIKIGDVDRIWAVDFYTYLPGSNGKPMVYFEASGEEGKVPNLYSITADARVEVPGAESMLRRFLEQAQGLFKKVGTGADAQYVRFDLTNTQDVKTLVAALEVAWPSDEVKGDLVLSSRYRTLQFKQGANTSGIYVAVDNGYKSIGTGSGHDVITLTEANKALMQQVGFCVKYQQGAAYFNIPVKHYGWYRAGNTQKDEQKIDWTKVRIGDFGMVRNHSYSVNVTKLTGLATGIGGRTDPIVPPADTDDYYVAYRVNILKWAVVPEQETEL